MGQKPACNDVAGFMKSNAAFFCRSDDFAFFLQATYHAVDGIKKVFLFDGFFLRPCGNQRSFITNIGYIGPGKTWSLIGQLINIYIRADGQGFKMNQENRLAFVDVW